MSLKELTAVLSSEQLLADSKRVELVQKIRDVSPFEEQRFDAICLTLIHNVSNYFQSLPETFNSYYSQTGGLIDHALNRTQAALELFKQFIIPEGSDVTEEQLVWLYALFSAALLKGIGKLQIDYQIECFDATGQSLRQWNPLLEPISKVGSHYRFTFLNEHDDNLRCRLNLLLARQLMPAGGFMWIASNPDVLKVWLALLNEDWQSAGTLGALLIRTDAIAIQRYFNQLLINNTGGARTGRANRITTFVDTTPESSLDKERMLGIEFIQWLTSALASGMVILNKGNLFMVAGGLLVSTDLFKLFIRDNPEYKNWKAVQNSLVGLGLHQVAADGSVVSRSDENAKHHMVTGVVLADYAVVLPHEMHIHHLSTQKENTISAVELIHTAQCNNDLSSPGVSPGPLAHLTAAGQWQLIDAINHSVQPGHSQGV